MQIGLLVEGKYDERPFEILAKRVVVFLLERDNKKIDFNLISQKADGGIKGSIKDAARLFFKTTSCEFAIFVADFGYNEDKGKKTSADIRKCVIKICKTYDHAGCVFAFPKPEFEQFFLDEDLAVKREFNLDGSKPIPHGELQAKERIEKLIDIQNDFTKSKIDYYMNLSSNVDIKILMNKSNSFKRFASELESFL